MSNSPLEVDLARCVKGCRRCKWFWQGTEPYGPYPGFDFDDHTKFPPKVIRAWPQTSVQETPREWLVGKIVGQRSVEPGVLHGCRKAPIMTVGINPNLTAFSVAPTSTPWVYPAFDSVARYAYYYRHFTLYQENLSPQTTEESLDHDHRLVARGDGYVTAVTREYSHNYIQLVVRYAGETRDTAYEIVWKSPDRWVVLRTGGLSSDPNAQFKKDEVLAARLSVPPAETMLYSAPVGYYQRMVPILGRFRQLVRCKGGEVELSVGEDVSQHDMVACASPGWQTLYDMPLDRIAGHCIIDQGWFVYQFVQSQPVVVIVVGAVALAMFKSVFAPYMTLKTDGKDLYQIMQETCLRPSYVTISNGAVNFKSRLIVAPHFSYADGFFPGSRVSTAAWAALSMDFPADAQLLNATGCVSKPDRTGTEPAVLVQIKPEVKDQLSERSRFVLNGYYLDPEDMIARALASEYGRSLDRDPQTGHLRRTSGPCQFCVNDQWQFPEGCAYGKPLEASLVRDSDLKAAAESILARARATAVENG